MGAPEAVSSLTSALPEADTVVSEALIRRYDVPGPRYTSYPTADRYTGAFDEAAYRQALRARAAQAAPAPLSVYVHIPFCRSLCYFCACNKIITQDTSRSDRYLAYLDQEASMVAAELGDARRLSQLHFGGGSPTFLTAPQLAGLMASLRRHFDFQPHAELGIEIDPRTLEDGTLASLAALGFNRTSFGVQDFDPAVQAAVNRIQPLPMVERAMRDAREAGFRSINTDLIYGLPLQSVDTFDRSLDHVLRLSPDRIALYNYAHLPQRFKAQRLIDAATLPSAETRLQIFLMAMRRLLDAGYVYIGLDHFAKPQDELNLARLSGGLHRNFQGYTTQAECDLVGLGVSAIGKVGATYGQSVRTVKDYTACLDAGRLPVERGHRLSDDDRLRQEVIMTLMCSMPLDYAGIRARHGVDFASYFAPELERLQPQVEAGLLQHDERGMRVTAKGRLFVRGIGMVFDAYLGKPTVSTYSRLI